MSSLFRVTISCPPSAQQRKRTEHAYLAHAETPKAAINITRDSFPHVMGIVGCTVDVVPFERDCVHLWTRRV